MFTDNGHLNVYENPIVRAAMLAKSEQEERERREAEAANELAAKRRIESCRERFFELFEALAVLFKRLTGLKERLKHKIEEMVTRRPRLLPEADLGAALRRAVKLYGLASLFVTGSTVLIYYVLDLLGHIPEWIRIVVAGFFALAAACGFHMYIRYSYPSGDDGRPKLSRRFVGTLLVVTIISVLSVACLRLLKDYVYLKQSTNQMTDADSETAMLLVAIALGLMQTFLGLLLDLAAGVCSSTASGMREFCAAGLQIHDDHLTILREINTTEEDLERTKAQITNVAAQVGPVVWQEWLKGRDALIAVLMWVIVGCGNPVTPHQRSVVAIVDETASTSPSQVTTNHHYVGTTLHRLRPGDELSVIAVNDASFAHPAILLQGRIPADDHPLQLVSTSARNQLMSQWQSVSGALNIRAGTSDVFGSICFAALLLEEKTGERWMYILSDFRNSTTLANLEDMREIPIESSLEQLRQQHLIPDLSGVKVVVLGVHTEGVTLQYHTSLRTFIRAYFQAAHAELVTVRVDVSWPPFAAEVKRD